MLHALLDHDCRAESPARRLPAALKLALALAVVAAALALPSTGARFGWLALAGFLAAVAAASRIPWSSLALRLLILEPFVLGVAILALFQPHGTAVFLRLLLRSTLCLLAMILLSATTPFADLLGVLRRAGVPALLVAVLALMYRYLYLLIDEAGRMGRARASRTFRNGRLRAWAAAAAVIGRLFVRSSLRAQRIYAAMCARGWA